MLWRASDSADGFWVGSQRGFGVGAYPKIRRVQAGLDLFGPRNLAPWEDRTRRPAFWDRL
jgi:hypothetical protein